ncbi:PilZ domain-containing protein [Roseibium denhamense]|uniref:PilZ domain-containing protein n=1 Tax=Roseibium denhamense TaxID=76305 RepID=A0ABY1PMD5_9HYPH|nr:PilZ domain-containing protein [Roseibium denhamense]MTI04119.1 PilZ domain-containing protein [Roseibium denhamense]SMP37348.1 PilZ domain-containing protein [Roseibium denhamense]
MSDDAKTGESTAAPKTAAGEIAETDMPRSRRSRVLKKGKIIFQKGLRSIPCIVRNISDGGAMLQFEQAYMLPKQFDLQIDLEDFEVSCERRWEDGLKCGVEFVSEKRMIGRQRAQVLKTSEEALLKDTDDETDGLDGYFQRKHFDNPQAVPQTVRQPRRTGGGRPAFGKRR